MIERKHHIGRVIQAQETAWSLACLAKKMEYMNSISDNDQYKAKAIRGMIADLASISLGIEEIDDVLRDALGDG